MRVTLVRHAEVEERYIGCYNGHKDIGLSAKGYADAKKLHSIIGSGAFKQCSEMVSLTRVPPFDAIFCSDLIRARETLKQFIDLSEAEATHPMLIYTKELREKSWGKHEGLSFDEIIAQGEVRYVDFESWIDSLDGESVESYTSRIKKFLFEYLPSTNKQNILLVTHSGVIKTFIAHVKEISIEKAFNYKVGYGSFVVYNTLTKELDIL